MIIIIIIINIGKHNWYNYENFELQNLAVKHMFSINFPEVLISDVYNPTGLVHLILY